MYGYLDFTIDSDQGLTATVPNWAAMTEHISQGEWENRKKIKSAVLREQCAQDPDPALVERVLLDLDSIIVVGPEMPVAFAVCMSLAHHRLPPEHRAQRTGSVERILNDHFHDVQPPHDALRNTIDRFRARATLFPDAVLEDEVRSFCFEMAYSLSREQAPPAGYDQTAFKAALQTQLKSSKYSQVPDLIEDLSTFVLSRPTDSREAFRQKTIDLLGRDQGTALTAAFIRLSMWRKMFPSLPIHQFDFYERAIHHLLTVGSADWTLVVGDLVNVLQSQINAQAAVVVWNSAAAVLEGVSMGPWAASSLDALQRRIQATQGVRSGITLQRIHKARSLAASDARKLSEQEALELGAVQAMSVDQLVQWIEGPVAEAGPKRTPIDRKAIVQRMQQSLKKDARSRPGSAPTSPPEVPITEESVEDTICNTLSANASFWEREIDHLIGLSKSIGLAPELTSRCSGLRGELMHLSQHPEAFEVEAARDLLLAAEEAVAALRQGIGRAKATNRVHERFVGKLGEALGKETKVLGKRHGGQIECSLTWDDWGYVMENFHGRWLPNVKTTVVDGKRMPLDNDQAAALYVTASSRSGFAFDVSVHLWRRRPGRTGMPGLSRTLYAPMNRDVWFDTYQPLCVLHVPLKD